MSPTAATISVAEVCNLFDASFAPVIEGMTQGLYVLWVGSGVSRERVDSLTKVLLKIIEYLHSKIDTGKSDCPYRKALVEILMATGLTQSEQAAIDITQPPASWPGIDDLLNRMALTYAKVLSVSVEGESDDYLLWNAADVRKTYGDDALQADAEHLAIAALGLEGVVTEIATANWDPLIERAFISLGAEHSLRVVVAKEDLQESHRKVRLIKFHGCAARAAVDETKYRPLLVARQTQIDAFTNDHAAFVLALKTLLITNPTLMVGLSAQDSNIRLTIANAAGILNRSWPSTPPACIFCEDGLSIDHDSVLRQTYGASFDANRDAIKRNAVLRAYGKPFLTAVLLRVLLQKLTSLAEIKTTDFPPGDVVAIQSSLKILCNNIAQLADRGTLNFVETLLITIANFLGLFDEGADAATRLPIKYRSLTPESIDQSLQNYSNASGRAELSLAIATLAHCQSLGLLKLELASPADGSIVVTTETNAATIFFVANEQAAIILRSKRTLPARSVIVHSLNRAARTARSPVAKRGRTGRPEVREVSIGQLLVATKTFDELVQAFRREAVL